MEMKIKASEHFMHGWVGRHLDAVKDHVYEVPHVVGEVLVKANLAEEVPADTPLSGQKDAPTSVTDSQDGADDLLGDTKAEADPENKMEKEPANKGKK